MKKLILLFVSVVFLAVAAQAQSQTSNTPNTQTQEIQKISSQIAGTVTTEQSTLKTSCNPSPNCNPSQCKKNSTGCCKNKVSIAKDDAASQTLVTGERVTTVNSNTVVESKLQTVSDQEVVKEQPAPKK